MHLMAKSTSGIDSIRQGYLDTARAWSCSNYYYYQDHHSHCQSQIPQSDAFKKKKRGEYRDTYSKNISILQHDIIRVFEESLHSDLYIIHSDNVLQTNCCILKTRSPHLYNVLEKYFKYNKNPIKCYLNTPATFHRLKGFVRLLYSNLDLTKQEQSLIEFIARTEEIISSDGFLDRNITCNIDDVVVDLSPSASEMADSGLETGSASLHENTESENSVTDFEESHVTDYVSADDDFIRVSLTGDVEKTCNKNATTTHRHDECCTNQIPVNNDKEGTETISSDVCACGDASELKRPNQKRYNTYKINDETKMYEIADDDVTRYENEVLNDPFYESDSNDNEQSGSFVPTGSFEFIEPGNLSPSGNVTTQEFLNCSMDENCGTRNYIVGNLRQGLSHSNDLAMKKSSSSVNSYYFIDASSLNDETEIAGTNAARDESMSGVSLPAYLENVAFIPSTIDSNEQNISFLNRKLSLQSGHERTAEFERELKLTEYLRPIAEPRKIKRVDSISDEKTVDEKQTFEKEALVVEIKEADSGESNHPSPCIDNNKKVQRENDECCVVNENLAENLSESRRSSLIRRNTFELESGDEKLSHLRQEYERRQGNLVFKNSIPQYSGHRVDGDLSYNETNYSSMPYFPTEPRTQERRRDTNNSRYVFTQTVADGSSSSNQSNDKPDDDLNGIYPISKSASDKLLNAGSETDDSSITDCNSLPATFEFPRDSSRVSTIKRSKRDELTPILSGGVSSMDYSKPIDSPSVRRKTESTPIVSGGSVFTNTPTEKIRSAKMSSSMNNAWVVDMSGCGRGNSRSNNGSSSSSMSQSFSFTESANKNINKMKTTDKPGSLGFFVNLNDINCPKEQTLNNNNNNNNNNNQHVQKADQDTKHQSCEFFIDISKESTKMKKITKKAEINGNKPHGSGVSTDKKNIFSIFIDLNDSDSEKKLGNEIKGETSDRLQARSSDESGRECGSESSSQELRSMDKKPSVFMFIDSDSPVVRRRTLSTSKPTFQRHSWNMDKLPAQNNGHIKESTFRREHKRAHSVSIDPALQKTLQVKSSGSSCSLTQIGRATSLQTSVITKEKEMISSTCVGAFDYDTRDTPPNSHVELMNEDLRSCVKKRHEFKELTQSDAICSSVEASVDAKVFEDDRSDVWDKTATESTEGHTRKSETFDISSGSASGPSPGSDNQVFELGEYPNEPSTFTERRQIEHAIPSKIAETHKSLTETIKKIECEFNKQEYRIEENYPDIPADSASGNRSEMTDSKDDKASCSGFVRLSDLDKAPLKSETNEPEDSSRPRSLPYRMSTSIPEMSWVESKLAVNRTHGPCQVRTLASRKFTSIMSTSLPAKHKSPIEEFANECEGEGIISESDLSSMQSSMGRSGADVSTEETETSSFANGKPYNRLGEDLLRMFLEEINPDVTIEINGRRIRAHKCILSSRCQYFAAILSGGWIESAGNVIALQGYSYNAVHFALCHIYSGESNIPESISIVELATLADMLCLEGLKEVIGYTIKVKYCHLFHKPCQICAVGVLECMPLAAAYGLDEVYRKSLRWITRHFVRIWPCKAFATLPRELMDKCYHQHIVHMSADNVLQTIMDCDKLLATLPNARWAEPVFKLVSNLLETTLKFLSENFSSVLSNDSFQALGGDSTWNISRLEDNVLASADRLPPDQACKSYSKLYKMLAAVNGDDAQLKPPWGPLFIDFLEKIQARVEKCLVKEASRAARTTTWLKMDLELRRRIQELACLVILPHEIIKRPSRHSNFMKESKTPPSRSSASRSLDLRRVKMTINSQNEKVTKQITIQPTKKLIPKPKSDPLERKMPEAKPLVAESIRPKSWPNKLEIKSRYLEPRTKSVPKETTQTLPERVMAQQRRKIMISSSDSSRTSSPAMKRATDKKSMVKMKLAVKKDVKALSSDSLTEAAGVKASNKRDAASKSCGITRPESPTLKPKDTEIGLSADSLADTKKKPITVKKTGKMDTSMSTDSLMNDMAMATPKSSASNKISPTLGRPTAKSLAMERAKKSSPPMNQKSPLTIARRPTRSLESSTAASRNRAAAVTTYHGSPNLRRNLLDAAKTPDVPINKVVNGVVPRVNTRQISSGPSTSTSPAMKRDKKESNPSSSESPSKRSPKSNSINRPNRVMQIGKKNIIKGTDDKGKTKCHSNGDAVKQFTVGSRSGTFLKDEPTILKKSDMKTMQVMS